MARAHRPATSHDVAARAGVAQSTVSRALRDLSSITPETKERVLRAARELDYVPRESGRSFSTRRTHRIAVVAEALTNPFYAQLVEPLRRALARSGYRTVLVADDSDDILTADALTDGSYDGAIITTAARHSRLASDLRVRGLPHVFANRTVDDADTRATTFANADGARMIADLLAEHGHHRVVLLSGPERYSTSHEREVELRAALRRRRISLPARDVLRIEYTAEAGRAAASAVLHRDRRPTAIVCGNDVVAIGALNAARADGLRVPHDLTVVGFDDIDAAAWDLVGLTTVRCDLDALADASVDLLLDEIGGDRERARCAIEVTLALRSSHGDAPRDE
jgi:LacI family transcriptional regulator